MLNNLNLYATTSHMEKNVYCTWLLEMVKYSQHSAFVSDKSAEWANIPIVVQWYFDIPILCLHLSSFFSAFSLFPSLFLFAYIHCWLIQIASMYIDAIIYICAVLCSHRKLHIMYLHPKTERKLENSSKFEPKFAPKQKNYVSVRCAVL